MSDIPQNVEFCLKARMRGGLAGEGYTSANKYDTTRRRVTIFCVDVGDMFIQFSEGVSFIKNVLV